MPAGEFALVPDSATLLGPRPRSPRRCGA